MLTFEIPYSKCGKSGYFRGSRLLDFTITIKMASDMKRSECKQSLMLLLRDNEHLLYFI